MAGAMCKRKRRPGKRRFIRLWTNVKRSQPFHSLSVYARSGLIELLDRYTGINNGMIGLGARELAAELKCGKDAAARALRELDDSGLARPTTPGVWRGKRATEWRLTFYPCDKTGEPPILNWAPRTSVRLEGHKVRLEGRKTLLSPSGGTQETKNPMNGKPLSPSGRTHIDIPLPREHAAPRWCKHRKALVTADGTALPIVDHPLVGTPKERAALKAADSNPEPYPDLPDFLRRARV
jgi:hypothetical protein